MYIHHVSFSVLFTKRFPVPNILMKHEELSGGKYVLCYLSTNILFLYQFEN